MVPYKKFFFTTRRPAFSQCSCVKSAVTFSTANCKCLVSRAS